MAAASVALTGATGYLGRPLLHRLLRARTRITVLTRNRAEANLPAGCEVVEGDLRDPACLRRLLEPGCDLVNLAYLWDGSEQDNLEAVRALCAACGEVGVRRLLQLSTVAVFGRAPGDRLDEASPCMPVIPYGRTKLAIEELLRSECRVPYAILRPATVFGESAPPLDALIADLRAGRRLAGYLRSSLFGRRRMNLVHRDNVAAALEFLLEVQSLANGEVFIVSDDEHPANNYVDIERHLMRCLGVADYALPRIPRPDWLLGALLRLRRHNNVNPRRTFDPGRLSGRGYRKPVEFLRGLSDLVAR